jgi:acetate kinase
MNVLVLNCGSSSVRFQVIDTDPGRTEKDADRRSRTAASSASAATR